MCAMHSSSCTCPCFLWQNFISFSKNLALFSQNSVNTNLVEHGATGNELDIRNVSIAVKFVAKFWKKMNDHIKDDTIPKEIPSFARTMFVEPVSGIVAAALVAVNKSAATSTVLIGAKGKKYSNEPSKKKQKRETSNKSLKMGLFHMEKGATVATALPENKKGKLKEDICMDFCCHDKKCNFSPLALQERQALHHLEKRPRKGQGGTAYSHG
jgi:hypothetical protein